ncbi:Aldo/keto reductase [Wolfiporia cocos MD-104 SS10]|uniref:Aldo/keto reductase n=1 Tax=Wolfiporia cocos (strain MD-104) TaxID=742152 RepID=A0A2H3JCS2_WOLCO|nr:Aldo/keto reductase [Wolfiporia cocos MD-104 SS10]
MAPASNYPTRQIGANGPYVSALGFGAMGMGAWYGKTDEVEAYKTLTYAADRGVTFWDTADVYGTSEEMIGKWFTETGRREEIFLATKFGSMDMSGPTIVWTPKSTPSYIRTQLERSFKALQTDYIDLYYQHRVDPNVPIEVVLETLRPYMESGKIRYLGLSECSIEVLRRAKAVPGVGEKVVVCQMEYSPFTLEIETSGFVAAARELGVAIVAYSPLGRGLITGRYKSRKDFDADDVRLLMPRFSDENLPKNVALARTFADVAQKYDATPSQAALAWILAVHPDFVPIPGTRSVARLEENAKAAEIQLSEKDVKLLSKAVREADVVGERYSAQIASMMVDQCIELSQWKGE